MSKSIDILFQLLIVILQKLCLCENNLNNLNMSANFDSTTNNWSMVWMVFENTEIFFV